MGPVLGLSACTHRESVLRVLCERVLRESAMIVDECLLFVSDESDEWVLEASDDDSFCCH